MPLYVFMDVKALQELLEKIFENPKVEDFARGIAHILSYLNSEQDKRIELTTAMEEFKELLYGGKSETGIIHIVNEMNARSEKNQKLIRAILASVIGGFGLQLLLWIVAHVKF